MSLHGGSQPYTKITKMDDSSGEIGEGADHGTEDRRYDRSAGGLQEEAYRHDSTRRAGLPQRWGIHDSMKCEANTSGKVQYDQSSRFGGSSGKKVSGFLLASFPGPSFPFFPLKKGN